eukprot:3451479-Pyramimonas_sp.AAC.1
MVLCSAKLPWDRSGLTPERACALGFSIRRRPSAVLWTSDPLAAFRRPSWYMHFLPLDPSTCASNAVHTATSCCVWP